MFKTPENTIKIIFIIISLIFISYLIKVFLKKVELKRLEPFKTVISMFLMVLAFYIGLFYASKDGNTFYIALYPLYVVIFVATIAGIKNRSHHIAKIRKEYLLKEFGWGIVLAIFSLFALILMNIRQYFAPGIILAFNLLFVGFLFNLGLIYITLKRKNGK